MFLLFYLHIPTVSGLAGKIREVLGAAGQPQWFRFPPPGGQGAIKLQVENLSIEDPTMYKGPVRSQVKYLSKNDLKPGSGLNFYMFKLIEHGPTSGTLNIEVSITRETI